MSWSAKTWQPPVRRDGPLLLAGAFFLAPGLFFIIAWYTDHFSGSTPDLVAWIAYFTALLTPVFICYRLATRAERRRWLWSLLVLAGSAMALWLPAQYLLVGGPLAPGASVALPDALSRVSATTFVASVPLLMGMIPVVLYGLAPGQDRPLVGIPPRAAVVLAAAGGVVLWVGVLFLVLLNPIAPPFVPPGERVEALVTVTRPPALPAELEPATWAALFWRLHDGLPPGARDVAREGEESIQMTLPAIVHEDNLAPTLMGRGRMEIVDAGDTPPAGGALVSTSTSPLPGPEAALETILTGEDLLYDVHWSGVSMAQIILEPGAENSVLVIALNAGGEQALERFAAANSDAFLSLVLDNVAFTSFPVLGAIEENRLVVRRLDPEVASALSAIMRYGPLPLVPQVELAP